MDFRRLCQKARKLYKTNSGSEAVEMVYTTAMMLFLIMVGLTLLIYLVEFCIVNYATKAVVRNIETTGTVNYPFMESTFRRATGSSRYLVNKRIEIVSATYVDDPRYDFHIELGNTFKVRGTASYRVRIAAPGFFAGFNIDMPIVANVTGISEVHVPGQRLLIN